MRLSVHTQTPVVRFLRDVPPAERRLATLVEGRDHLASPGGVTRMVRAFLRRLEETRRLDAGTWMSLSSGGPSWVDLSDRVRIEHVRLDAAAQREYAQAKGAVWSAVHGLAPPAGPVDVERGLGRLADAMAARTASLDAREPFDAFYVHDFQLLGLAEKLPAATPRIFHWHIPARLPPSIRPYVVRRLDQHDSIVVSTHAYAQALEEAGVNVPIHASYPYVDDGRLPVITDADVAAFESRWGIGPDDIVYTLVARLDPVKSQDVAIRALARIADEEPRAKILLIGGGGFSAGRRGLGMSYADGWRARLKALARERGIADRVIFTGTIPDAELEVAHARSRAGLLPSALEGFGLVAVESWLRGKPVIVSQGAGVSELVENGANGYVHAPGDDKGLADAMLTLARDPALAEDLGANGRATARHCSARRQTERIWNILAETIEACARS